MSVSIVIIGTLPVAATAWTSVGAAAMAAASALGFAVAKDKAHAKVAAKNEVKINVKNSEAVTQGLAAGQEMVFIKEEVKVTFYRDEQGQFGVKVDGRRS